MLELARSRSDAVEWIEGGFLTYEHDGDPPQLVHSRNALHHLPDFWKGVALVRLHDLLAPGGVLVLRDLVYDFKPGDADRRIEEWLAGAAPTPAEGWTRGELENTSAASTPPSPGCSSRCSHTRGFEIVDRERARRHLCDVRLQAAVKKRLDVVLVERGLAESRAQAQALVIAGLVPGYDKPGQQVDEDVELTVEQPPPYVSRGGEKLAHGLDALGVDPAGLDCVDVGASTGGFTDVLLQRGAARVIAVDVGYGQLHPRLRGDPRVTVLERTNARTLTELPFAPELVVCDVSFISVRLALPPVLRLCAPGWQAVVLVKPQFEAGRADVGKGGVVRDLEVRRRVIREVAEAAQSWGASVRGVVDSGLPGPKGNREIFLHLVAFRAADASR